MKKLIFYSFLVIVVSACDDVLNEVPKDFISAENFYENTQQVEDALIGAYNAMWWEVGGHTYKNFLNLHNDYTEAMGSFTSLGNFDSPISSDQFGRIEGFWEGHYQQINRANIILNRAPQVEDMEESTLSRILGEAHFLRAYAYFELLRYFGPAPIRNEEFSGESELGGPRASKDQMYDLIISDLQVCETDCPVDVSSNSGRASQGAAKMLLAQVYLDKEEWSNAAQKAEELINSSQYSLIPINESDDFYEIFATTSTNEEEIMAFHFSANNQAYFLRWWHTNNTPYGTTQIWGDTNLPNTQSAFISNWDENDLRKDFNLFSSWVDENGETQQLPGEGLGSVRYKKYIALEGAAIYNQPIYRLAEAYLMYAEAAALANGSPTNLALDRLNVIKRRGYGYDPYSPSPVDYPEGMSIDEFRDAVIAERGYEFFIEDRRWWDLKRTDQFIERVSDAVGMTVDESRLLLPIPSVEIETNPDISQSDQNPGY